MSNDTLIPQPPSSEAVPAEKKGLSRKALIILISVVAVLLLLVLGAIGWYLKTGKPLSQIPILSQETPPHFVAAMYGTQKPLGVALDEVNSRVYVTQSGGDMKVKVLDFEGNEIGVLEAPKSKDGTHLPVYVAVDPATQDVYVSDRASHALYVYDSSGNYLRTFLPEGVKGWNPLGVTFSTDGSMFVSDVSDPRQVIWQLQTDGTVLRKMGEADKLNFVNGLAVTPEGKLVAADSNSGRVLLYDSGNKAAGALARGDADSPMGLPRGVAVDDRGRVYVVDTVNQVVRAYVPSDDPTSPIPVYAFSFGAEGTIDGAFEFPNGVAVDSKGKVYVTDRENNRVQVWSY